MIRRRQGFTIIELMTVMIVIGLLAGMALLKYIDLRHRARAVQVAADLETVRLAAYNAWYEHNTWPNEAGPGQVPADSRPTFRNLLRQLRVYARLGELRAAWRRAQRRHADRDGDHWLDAADADGVGQTLGNKMAFVSSGGTLTFIIVGPDGKS